MVTEAAEFTVDVDFALDMDSSLGDVWETNLRGLQKWGGSFAGNFDTAQAGGALWEAAVNATSARKMYFYPDRGTTANYYYGNIWPKLSVKGGIGARGTFSGTYVGDGQLAQN